MPDRRPDRAFRRAVAELAALHRDDLGMVLDALAPAQRARIEALVAGHAEEPPAAVPEAPPPAIYEGVSPWLLVRIDPGIKAGRAGREFVLMTDAAGEALRAAAEPFRRRDSRSGRVAGRTLLDRAWRALAGKPA